MWEPHSLFDDPSTDAQYVEQLERDHQHDQAIGARDRAIDRAESHANTDFMEEALQAVRLVARTQPVLTTEDCYALVEADTHEPRAWGAVMREAAKRGWVTAGPYVESRRKESHCRPMRSWYSQLCLEDADAA